MGVLKSTLEIMASENGVKTSERKQKYAKRLNAFLDEHSKFVTIIVDNIGSKSLNLKRASFRKLGVTMLKGKNTLTRKILALRAEKLENARNAEAAERARKLLPLASGNMAFLFLPKDTNIARLCDDIAREKTIAPAKAGAIAPTDVSVQPGPTALQPGLTPQLSAMGFSTRINRGQIDITTRRDLIKAGDKVSKTAAEVLKLLNIKPFKYGIKVEMVCDEGMMFPSKFYGETRDAIRNAYANILSIGLALPEMSWPHLDHIRHQIANPIIPFSGEDLSHLEQNFDQDEPESVSEESSGVFQFSDDSEEDSSGDSDSDDGSSEESSS